LNYGPSVHGNWKNATFSTEEQEALISVIGKIK